MNSIPLLFIELNGRISMYEMRMRITTKIIRYHSTIVLLQCFVMLSNGLEAKVGTVGSKYEFFHEWKRQMRMKRSVAFETMLLVFVIRKTFLIY
ncbi:MAG: hypothetical protein ACLR5T_00275 [Veillonella sp.]